MAELILGIIVATDIIIGDGATIAFVGNVTAHNINGNGDNQDAIIFNNNSELGVDSTIGQGNKINSIEIANNNVVINDDVSSNNIIFSSRYPATLTLNGLNNTIDNVTTTGNNLHSLAIAQDFASSATSIGLPNNRLKNIYLLADKTVTIDSNNFYSGVSTSINNRGKVIFNSDNSFSYGLGANNYNLSEVNFTSNARVIGDVYVNSVHVNSGKVATFSGDNNRVENLRGILGRVFNYSTLINSQAGITMEMMLPRFILLMEHWLMLKLAMVKLLVWVILGLKRIYSM
ncbi:MAG: hypothetical protein RCG15_05115 [Candidatus Rickettsia vulgarisii]